MKKLLLLFIAFFLSINVHALELNYGVDVGESKHDVRIYRVFAQKEFDTAFYDNEYLSLSGYHEASLNFWDSKRSSDTISALAYSPVFTLSFKKCKLFTPYVEAGVGVAVLSDRKIDTTDMSTNFQFEDRVGIGFKKGDFDFHLRYMHYSNGGIKGENDGVDLGLAGFSYRF